MLDNQVHGKLLEHTADVRMEFSGRTLEELFLHAGLGLTEVMLGTSPGEGSTEIRVVLEADNVEELLVNWLREVLFTHEARSLVMTGASFDAISEQALQGILICRPRGEDDPGEMEIKAITYHGLVVERTVDGFVARVIFDI